MRGHKLKHLLESVHAEWERSRVIINSGVTFTLVRVQVTMIKWKALKVSPSPNIQESLNKILY